VRVRVPPSALNELTVGLKAHGFFMRGVFVNNSRGFLMELDHRVEEQGEKNHYSNETKLYHESLHFDDVKVLRFSSSCLSHTAAKQPA
ncbi:MAG TPA: hypothetical protein VF473_07065, partial [Cyclobacteriaceae bacterium]